MTGSSEALQAPANAGALAAAAERADSATVGRLIDEHYGLRGQLTSLTGERDSNFRLDTADGVFLVKVTHPDEDLNAVDAQWTALGHVRHADPALPLQRQVHTSAGDGSVIYPPDSRRRLRITQFLPGLLRRDVAWQPPLAASIGECAARLDRALADFRHPFSHQALLWDLRRAQDLRPLLAALDADPLQPQVQAVLDRHAELLPRLAREPSQAIHNDLNPTNLLVSEDGTAVCGILDFGDMIVAPRIVELAVACAYLTDADDPLKAIADCAAAYVRQGGLEAGSLAPLADLVATRWAMTVLITEWRSRLQPDNARYILRNNPASRRGLQLLDHHGQQRLHALLEDTVR